MLVAILLLITLYTQINKNDLPLEYFNKSYVKVMIRRINKSNLTVDKI